MLNSKIKSKSDFLTTFFIEDRAVTRLLIDIIKNKNNRLYMEELGLPDDFEIPFLPEENTGSFRYILKNNPENKYSVKINGEPCSKDEYRLNNGDYFEFESDNEKIKVLCISTSDVEVGYEKYEIPKDSVIFIGRNSENDISYNLNDFISRNKHVAIHVDSDGVATVEDIKRNVGVYVNGKRIYSKKLEIFDEIFILGLSIVYMGDYIAVSKLKCSSRLHKKDDFTKKEITKENTQEDYFVSTPRILKSLDNYELDVDAPPSPFVEDKTPAALVLGPSLTMSLVMLASISMSIRNAINGGDKASIFVSSFMAVGMLAGAILWPILLRRYKRKQARIAENHRQERYTSYISEIENNLIEKQERAVRVMKETLYPSPNVLCSMLDSEENKLRLWERSYDDEDFLDVRIGVGKRPFGIQLKIPRTGFQLFEDELRVLPSKLANKYSVLNDVPLTIDIKSNHTIGIIGNPQNMQTIIDEIILNIISLHSYDEVKLVFVTSPNLERCFEKYKNAPHVWTNDKKIRYFATNTDEAHFIFSNIFEAVNERDTQEGGRKVSCVPHYVLIVTEQNLIEKEALSKYLYDADNKVGITTLFAYGDITKLPKSCRTIIQSDEAVTGYYMKNENKNQFVRFELDKIDSNHIRKFTHLLSKLPIKKDVRSLGIADRISFMQMYKVGNVNELEIESHWDYNNSSKSLAAPIGVMAGGEIFSLDLHESYHGCHGLVAGTTGSGKSEFLQEFVLSLAINYSPKEVAFVLVDFKGGDMARPFMKKVNSPALPHLAATISNLSGNILYRALVSFEAEIASRQKIFNEAAMKLGVDKIDINTYHKYYKDGRLETPLPHLVIIIDEFAQLKTQQPEFLTQLINIAQVGRSLGIHLILATQKPSGIVDPQIVSNSRFKVCLKVADKQDSIDMLNKPDAAMIKNPGRMYLQVGYNEIYECIQSGYSGADYTPTDTYMSEDEITVQMTDNTAKPIHSAKLDIFENKSDKTQLEAIVSEIVKIGQKKNVATRPLWLDVLPTYIDIHGLRNERKGLCRATVGLADYIRTQEQKPITIDFARDGHIGIYGASGMGKTTFIQTLVYSMVSRYEYTPEELNIYAMDFGGRSLGYLKELPHTGCVAFAGEENKLSDLSNLLHEIIDERKKIFADSNCGTFVEYHKSCKKVLPAILVIIDNFASFRDKSMDISESLIDVISSGKTFGVYFVITGNTRNSIYYKYTEHISSYYTLKMNDPTNYLDIHNVRPKILPEEISGRGITKVNKELIEFQTAIAHVCDSEVERIGRITEEYKELSDRWEGFKPRKLEDDYFDNVDSKDSTLESCEDRKYVPVSKNNPPDSIEDEIGNLILGKSKSRLLTYGITLSESHKVCVCADDEDTFKEFYNFALSQIDLYNNRLAIFVDDDSKSYENIVDEYQNCDYISGVTALNELIERLKPELNARLKDPNEDQKQIYIFISDFNRFFEMMTDEQAFFMRKMLKYINSPEYGIYFICGFNVNENKNNDSLFMSLVVKAENFIICPNSYKKALSQIESLPHISTAKSQEYYLCLKDKVVEIRW